MDERLAEGNRVLIELAKAGDRSAYAELFRRHADRIRRVAFLLLHDSGLADDAVQEAFARGLSKLSTYRGDAEPHVWIYSIGLNICRRHLRDATIRVGAAARETLDRGRRPAGARRGVITSVMRRETAHQLSMALGFLTEPQREVFVLHYTEGLPYESVSKLLQITPQAARSLAHRAKQVLRARLPKSISRLKD